MSELAISVIFICHNDTGINICLDSVLGQVQKNDEIIVVDDHSNTDTLLILNRYAEKKLINLICSEKVANRSYNRNLGVRNSKNPILVFFDGDMVLGNHGLKEIRLAHERRCEKAFIGNKHAINLDEIQLNLYASIPDYLLLLSTEEGRMYLENNPLFIDSRKKSFSDIAYQKYYWTNYYTGLCSVERDIFDLVKGFDESFITWGSEDVDFGYRLSKYCKIGFILDLHGFHIPHKRDIIKNELSNRENILYMLKKYNSWEFEILHNFYGYGHFTEFDYVIQQMRLLTLSDKCPSIPIGDIVIDSISKNNPTGMIQYFVDNTMQKMNSMGVSIPVSKHFFETAYVSDHIFIYPQLLTSRILQESLRIARRVYIYRTSDSLRIDWRGILKPEAQKKHFGYEANDLYAYTFFPTLLGHIEVKTI